MKPVKDLVLKCRWYRIEVLLRKVMTVLLYHSRCPEYFTAVAASSWDL
jgi:hypothetical protein